MVCLNALTRHLQPQVIQARERAQVRAIKGSIGHVEVFQMDGVGISIIGRPRPIPGHDTPNPANNTYTLNYEEPVIAGRLGQPDALAKHQTSGEASETSGISAAVAEQRGRILRAQRDYDAEVIEGCDLKRIREAAEARIVELEAERLLRDRGGVLAPILGTEDTAAAFREAPLEVRRQVIDTLATVTLHAQPRGRRGFDPASVTVEWRWQSRQSATVGFWA